jgi:hypothetical protein
MLDPKSPLLSLEINRAIFWSTEKLHGFAMPGEFRLKKRKRSAARKNASANAAEELVPGNYGKLLQSPWSLVTLPSGKLTLPIKVVIFPSCVSLPEGKRYHHLT